MMDLPIILECDATECAYNAQKQCHIKVGHRGDQVDCLTFQPQ